MPQFVSGGSESGARWARAGQGGSMTSQSLLTRRVGPPAGRYVTSHLILAYYIDLSQTNVVIYLKSIFYPICNIIFTPHIASLLLLVCVVYKTYSS